MESKCNHLKMKDIITLAIFNAAILVVMVAVKMVVMIFATPAFNYLAYVGVMAFFCAPLYVVMSNKVAKTGTLFVTALFSGVLMLVFGSGWFLIVELLVGVICEIVMWGENTYKNPVRNGIAYALYWLLYAWGSAIPLYLFKEQYLDSLAGSYTAEGIQTLVFYGTPAMLGLIGLITVVLTVAGYLLGCYFLKKHIKKAKLV